MSEVANKMRLMLAAPHMAIALKALLPMAWREYSELSAVAMFSADSEALYQAGKWLEGILLAECALKEAGVEVPLHPQPEPVLEVSRPRLQLVSKAVR